MVAIVVAGEVYPQPPMYLIPAAGEVILYYIVKVPRDDNSVSDAAISRGTTPLLMVAPPEPNQSQPFRYKQCLSRPASVGG